MLLFLTHTSGFLISHGVHLPFYWDNDTEYLAKIAATAGYTLQELLSCLNGKPIPETSDLSLILRQIQHMPLSQVAQIVQAAADRLAAVAEASRDEAKAS